MIYFKELIILNFKEYIFKVTFFFVVRVVYNNEFYCWTQQTLTHRLYFITLKKHKHNLLIENIYL